MSHTPTEKMGENNINLSHVRQPIFIMHSIIITPTYIIYMVKHCSALYMKNHVRFHILKRTSYRKLCFTSFYGISKKPVKYKYFFY